MSEKEKQMSIVLDEIKNGKTRKEAAEITGIPLYRIVHWYNEGKNGFGKDNIEFYRKLEKIENNVKNDGKLTYNNKIKNSNKLKSRKIKKSKELYYYKPEKSLNNKKIEFKKYSQGNLKFLNVKAKTDRYLSKRPHYLFDGDYYNAEYYAIEYYKSKGYNAFFSENTSWKGLIRYLFKDILEKFKKFSRNKGYKSNYWDKEHFNYYKKEIYERFDYLKKYDFNKIVFKKLGSYRRKNNIMNICNNLEKEQILNVLYYILQDYHHQHVGFPDIFVYNNNEAFFCEVKTKGDYLKASQVRAHETLLNSGIDVCYFSINKTDNMVDEEKSKYFNENYYDEESYVEVYENKIKIANNVYEELKNSDIKNTEKFFLENYNKYVFLAFLNVINRFSLYDKILACQRLNEEIIDESLKKAEKIKNLHFLSKGYTFYEKGLYDEAIENFIHVKTFDGYYLLSSSYRKKKDGENEVKVVYDIINNVSSFSCEEMDYFKKRANSFDKNIKAISVYKTDKKCPKCGSDVILTELHKRNNVKIFKCSSSTCYWFGGVYGGSIDNFSKYYNPSEYKTVNVDLSDFELDLNEMSSKEKRSLRSKLFRKARKHQNNVELYESIAYYEQMLNHELFADNYRPYKELSVLYRKTKQFEKDTEILTEFFKSNIKCKDTQLMWFKKRLYQLVRYGRLTKLEAEHLEREYEKNNSIIF